MHILYSGSQTLGVKWVYTILEFWLLKNTFTCTGGKKKLTQKNYVSTYLHSFSADGIHHL